MPRPGVEIVTKSSPPARGAPSDTGAWFIGGLADRGPSDTPVLLHNMGEFEATFGPRTSYGFGWDAADVAFRIGAQAIHFARTTGPAATFDAHVFNDAGAVAALNITAIGEGATNLSVAIAAGVADPAKRIVIVTDTGLGREVERSPELADNQAIIAWATGSDYVRAAVAGAGGLVAVVATQALAGGADDRAAITDVHRIATINSFGKALGPGQVSYPGATTTAVHAALLNHAAVNNRDAILDAVDTPNDATLRAIPLADRLDATLAEDGETYGAIFAGWPVVPGVVRGTTRTVPPSAVVAGLIARTDGRYHNPNLPAAGVEGETDYPVSVSAEWDDDTREALSVAGVNVLRMVYGALRVYGWRSLVDPNGQNADWLQFSAARTRMAVQSEADALAENFVFAQIDGQGHKISEFEGALRGLLQRFWTIGALYGATADEAYTVDTGPTVNTADTVADGQLRAKIGLRTSPFAELVYIEVTKVPVTSAL
jgi:phage tail sheath protein FI